MKLKILFFTILFSTIFIAQDVSNLENSSMYALNKISVTAENNFRGFFIIIKPRS